jgi:hypothetical protein
MDLTRAEKQLEEFKQKGLIFNYNFDYNVIGFNTYAINMIGFSMVDILSALKSDEVITFLLNDGCRVEGSRFDNTYRFIQDKEYENSIYWYSIYHGDTIRIKTNYSDFSERVIARSKLIIRSNKINKILNNIHGK